MKCSAKRGEEGQPHQSLVCTTFSSFSRPNHLKILGKLYSSHVLGPNVAIFLKDVFIFKDRTLKKNNIERTMILRWFGRENEENVVQTRD